MGQLREYLTRVFVFYSHIFLSFFIMPSSIVYHTQKVPRSQDWYYDLCAVIPLFRVLSKPPPSNLSSEPAYKSCREGRLLRDITEIHAAIVSSCLFSFLLSVPHLCLLGFTICPRPQPHRRPLGLIFCWFR
jgi:hypothetical protein